MAETPEQRLAAAREDECVLVPAPLFHRLCDLLSAVPSNGLRVREIDTTKGRACQVAIHEEWYAERASILQALPHSDVKL